MYRFAYKYSEEVIFYFDSAGNKYVATGGNLAWRINNPGLVSSHNHFSRANGAIGSCGRYAIFSDPLDGRKTLNDLKVMEHYIKQRTTHYENEFSKISNLTILDPDPDSKFKHKLDSECYQKVIQQVIKKYQKAIT